MCNLHQKKNPETGLGEKHRIPYSKFNVARNGDNEILVGISFMFYH